MAKGLGGYQPDTRSPSSRRADFELRRRVAALEEGGGGGGGGDDEVWVGPTDPGGTYELWYDTDATSLTPPAAPLSYIHNQGAAASTWVILHNLGWYPNVVVEDSGGTTCEGEIVFDNANQLTLTFSAAFAGVAYLS